MGLDFKTLQAHWHSPPKAKARRPRPPHSEATKLKMAESAKQSAIARQAQLKLGPEKRKHPVRIDGVRYDSLAVASLATGLNKSTLRKRLASKSAEWSAYVSLKRN